MGEITLNWAQSDVININQSAREFGFDLEWLEYATLKPSLQQQIQDKVVGYVLETLEECWSEARISDTPFKDVTKGVYVISLGRGLFVDYALAGKTKRRDSHARGQSPVIYIGRGRLQTRLKAHLSRWLGDFSYSLQGVALEFWMTEVKLRGSRNAFCDVEHDLLQKFFKRHGCYPLQNSISGTRTVRTHSYTEGWDSPLQRSANGKGWAIAPLAKNPWRRTTPSQ